MPFSPPLQEKKKKNKPQQKAPNSNNFNSQKYSSPHLGKNEKNIKKGSKTQAHVYKASIWDLKKTS